ncbi:DUF6220 domain-containing protein [Paenibacillus flagellatus]|uniref:Uncharacterized protein n=1 Tax=Paenibacillus flagellatus TaxID=2211139 RepID=A0A2V5K647_9BACL|nr:DUF6220 domain-containing protein [Paenibacillus flagellatus]PYI54252.1 hypothetical protein DLM86_12280 [Paenibacillus flagellatus]
METIRKKKPGGRGQVPRLVYAALAWGMVGCLVAQTFLAGMAIFNNPEHWGNHARFVHLFEWIPILMLIVSWAGRLPKGTGRLSFALFALVFSQYMTANVPAAGALHPVIAMALVLLSVHVAVRATKCFGDNLIPEENAGA